MRFLQLQTKITDMSDQFEKVQLLIKEVEAAQPETAEALEAFRIQYLGSKGLVKSAMEGMRVIPAEQKKEFGQVVNLLKQVAEDKYNQLKEYFEAQKEAASVGAMDLSRPAESLPLGARHPVSITLNRIIRIFEKLGFVVADGPEVEHDWYNFTAMNTPEDHPARDMQDTFYILDAPGMLLRTHTSIVQARVMTSRKPPIRIIAPGRVFRNESISAVILRNTYIDIDVLETLLQFPNVVVIDIQGCRVDNDIWSEFACFPMLEYLAVHGAVDSQSERDLHYSLPEVKAILEPVVFVHSSPDTL
jgi:hypothetical protein